MLPFDCALVYYTNVEYKRQAYPKAPRMFRTKNLLSKKFAKGAQLDAGSASSSRRSRGLGRTTTLKTQ